MLKSGQILCDRYRLVEQLGRHPGRQTWRARDLSSTIEANREIDRGANPGAATHTDSPLAETVIIKLLAFSDEIDWGQIKLFEREATVLQRLNHPAIPCYRDSFSIEDRLLWFCIVQDDIPGQSLDQLLQGGGPQLKEAQLRQWAKALLNILVYLHGQSPPILHRDIKPSNVIWGDDQQLYLIDLGAVQNYIAQGALGSSFTVVGTYGYTPLEQFGGRSVPASDLYALGATLIHLLTGIAPADLPQENLRLQFDAEISTGISTGISAGFRRWLSHLLEPDVQRRMPSAQAALTALEQLSAPSSLAAATAATAFPRRHSVLSAPQQPAQPQQSSPQQPSPQLAPPQDSRAPLSLSPQTQMVPGAAAPPKHEVSPSSGSLSEPWVPTSRSVDSPPVSPENWAPVGARLRLTRSPDLLLVEIPGEELGYSFAVLGVGFTIWSLLASSVALPFCLLFTVIGIFLAAPQILRFERQGREIRFSLGKPLGGYLIRLGRRDRSGWVRQVFHTLQSPPTHQPPHPSRLTDSPENKTAVVGRKNPRRISNLQSNRRHLVVQTQQRDIPIRTSLSWQEGTWLVSQIYAWFDAE